MTGNFKVLCETEKELDKVLDKMTEEGIRWSNRGEKPKEWSIPLIGYPIWLYVNKDKLTWGIKGTGFDGVRHRSFTAEKYLDESKFKAGDKVRIKHDLHVGGDYKLAINDAMTNKAGDIVTIRRIKPCGHYDIGDLNCWTDAMFEPVETIVIYREGNKVIALDKSTGKKAEARCCPDNEFDFEVGAKLAFERLMRPEPKFKAGDRVIGNSDKYNITGKGWRGTVVRLLDPEKNCGCDILVEDRTGNKFRVESKYFDLDSSSIYFTGKVVCVSSRFSGLTEGKIYEFVDGYSRNDSGVQYPYYEGPVKSVEHLNDIMYSQFIEVVE